MGHPITSNVLMHVIEYITGVFKPCSFAGEWTGAETLPFYLKARFAFEVLSLDEQRCLLMWDESEQQEESASHLKKSVATISERFLGPVIYGVSDTTSYNRKRLINQGIAFVVPGKQLYLPFAALDLRENFAPARSEPKVRLGACAQQLVILKCLDQWESELPAQSLAARLGVSKMTVSRAYSELQELGIAQLTPHGRQVNLSFSTSGRQLWEKALPHLGSPVKREVKISPSSHRDFLLMFPQASSQSMTGACAAGEWALSHLGMLAYPNMPCFAVAAESWPALKKFTDIIELDDREREAVLIQLWRYEPGLVHHRGRDQNYVDPLSLYLSLRENNDDRVQIALDELLEETWNAQKEEIK